MEKEAAARGVTPEALNQAEVVAKASVSEADVKSVYTANRARLGNASEADGMEQVRSALQQQRQTERRNAFARELRAKYEVKVLLEPYRVPIELAGAPLRGNPKAAVTIVEFSDFECPFCVARPPHGEARARHLRRQGASGPSATTRSTSTPRPQKAGEAAACAAEQGASGRCTTCSGTSRLKLQVPELKQHAGGARARRPGLRGLPGLAAATPNSSSATSGPARSTASRGRRPSS